jgi:eukaryotic-like serine/threonine-protein kinase
LSDPQPGTVVLGRYALLRKIARGGMSTIWAAEDRKLERAVAVKLLAAPLADNEEVRRRFEREAMAIARLQSPHIVQVFDYGIDGERPVIVMELLHGEDLRRRLKKRRKLPLVAVADVVVQVARGLGEAHSAGIIHRDLKPGNIFFARGRQQEVLKILDFGVAKADGGRFSTGDTTKAGEILGTPHYMSPEQARAKSPVDHRTDLWSVGVLVYRMLCGHHPFTGHNPTQILIAAATETFHAPTIYARDAPDEIDDFMNKALSRDPEKRFGSAAEMANELVAIVARTQRSAKKAGVVIASEDTEEVTTIAADPGTIEMESPLLEMEAQLADQATADIPSLPPIPVDEWPSDPPMPSYPSAPTDPSHGSLGSAMLSAAPPERPNPRRQMVFGVLGACLLGFVSVVGVITWARHSAPPAPAAQPMPTIVATTLPSPVPEPEAAPAPEPEPEPSATPPEPEPSSAPVAPPTAKPVSKPKPTFKPVPRKPLPKPKPNPDAYDSRF